MTTKSKPADDQPELQLQNEILDFNTYDMPHSMVSGVTPDGAADGQCGLGLIPTLAEKVDTCILHQLQRSVLYSIGLAGSKSRNPEAKELIMMSAL